MDFWLCLRACKLYKNLITNIDLDILTLREKVCCFLLVRLFFFSSFVSFFVFVLLVARFVSQNTLTHARTRLSVGLSSALACRTSRVTHCERMYWTENRENEKKFCVKVPQIRMLWRRRNSHLIQHWLVETTIKSRIYRYWFGCRRVVSLSLSCVCVCAVLRPRRGADPRSHQSFSQYAASIPFSSFSAVVFFSIWKWCITANAQRQISQYKIIITYGWDDEAERDIYFSFGRKTGPGDSKFVFVRTRSASALHIFCMRFFIHDWVNPITHSRMDLTQVMAQQISVRVSSELAPVEPPERVQRRRALDESQ